MKATMQQIDTYIATMCTISFSIVGMQDISQVSNVIFLIASTISCGISILVGLKQLKKKK
jgi:hypothetical protein